MANGIRGNARRRVWLLLMSLATVSLAAAGFTEQGFAAESAPVEAEDISGRAYYAKVLKEIDGSTNWTEKALEAELGSETTHSAREFAGMIDEGNNAQAVKDFARLIKTYGEENVRKAAVEISLLGADNPLRNIGYIVGMLKRMAREAGGV